MVRHDPGYTWNGAGVPHKMRRVARVLGLDLGARRIGVAVTDELGLSAHPQGTLERRGGQRDLDAIRDLVRAHAAGRVVIGLPLSPEGERGRAALAAERFAERLRAVLDVPIELIDESFTTVEATSVLLEADLSRKRRKEVVDKVAAALILRRWLEAQRAGGTAA